VADDYTPTTEEVREAVAEWAWSRRMFRPELSQSDGREADRWLAAHDAEKRAEWEAEQAETEWEYGCKSSAHVMARRDRLAIVLLDQHEAEEHGHDCPSPSIVRRRRAGQWEFWLPVTNTESEGKA
jgi:hypothetical protein